MCFKVKKELNSTLNLLKYFYQKEFILKIMYTKIS